MPDQTNPQLPASLLSAFQTAAGEENVITGKESVDKLSKDFYWYSPVLSRQLKDKRADAAIRIDNLETLKKIVSLCSKHKVPIQLRGAGTGNYGQLIPLYGGVILDLAGMDKIISLDGGAARVEPGVRLSTIENEARKAGWELRCIPSTWVKSSMAGFLCGGSGGIGSITYGGINHGDNMKSVTLLTVEEEPRILKFEERECVKALHTYGTTGILIETEMRLGPKVPYEQLIFVCEDWDQLTGWSYDIACSDIRKRLVTQFEWPIPSYFIPLRKYMPEGHHGTFLLIDEARTAEVIAEAEKRGIRHTHAIPYKEPARPPYITDYTWNHTTLWAIKKDPSITYLQCGFGDNFKEQFKMLWSRFPGEIMFHLEYTRGNAKMRLGENIVLCGGIPLVKFTTEKRLNEIIDYCRDIGVFVANPHTFKLEEGGAHPDIEEKRKLKSEADPLGILNPGKMKTYAHNPFEQASPDFESVSNSGRKRISTQKHQGLNMALNVLYG